MARRRFLALLAAPLAIAACDGGGGTGPDKESIELRFGVVGGANFARQAPDGPVFQSPVSPLVVTGANGTLNIDVIRLVVAEFSLRGDDGFNGCGPSTGDDCDEYDLGAVVVNLPLSGGLVEVDGQVQPGTYTELEFEVEDLADDEETAAERERIQTVLAQVRQQVPDWPQNASMLVQGTFTPNDGPPQPFRVFLQAEIEVQTALTPALVVEEDGGPRSIQVLLDPASVFRQGNNVINLATSVGELAGELETGFRAQVDDDS